MNMGRCTYWPDCSFAHSLKELCYAPPGWTKSQQEVGYDWNPGTPKPDPVAMRLIEAYAKMGDPNEIPNWARRLLNMEVLSPQFS